MSRSKFFKENSIKFKLGCNAYKNSVFKVRYWKVLGNFATHLNNIFGDSIRKGIDAWILYKRKWTEY